MGLLGRPASESGSLCHGDGATHGAIVRRRVFKSNGAKLRAMMGA